MSVRPENQGISAKYDINQGGGIEISPTPSTPHEPSRLALPSRVDRPVLAGLRRPPRDDDGPLIGLRGHPRDDGHLADAVQHAIDVQLPADAAVIRTATGRPGIGGCVGAWGGTWRH